jgi:hypothetical protein
MYIMVYSWSQAIISAREAVGTPGSPPFGLIFANFMCAMTLGSFSFSYLTKDGNSTVLSSRAIQLLLSMSASGMLITVLTSVEAYRFWALCLFEFCLGVYFPSMGYLKGNLIANEQRAKIYGFIRVPLNAFVVASLATVQEGMVPTCHDRRRSADTMCNRERESGKQVHVVQRSLTLGHSSHGQICSEIMAANHVIAIEFCLLAR